MALTVLYMSMFLAAGSDRNRGWRLVVFAPLLAAIRLDLRRAPQHGEMKACTPYPLSPTPYSLNPTPYSLNPTPYTLKSSTYSLNPPPYSLNPAPYSLNPTFYLLTPTPYSLKVLHAFISWNHNKCGTAVNMVLPLRPQAWQTILKLTDCACSTYPSTLPWKTSRSDQMRETKSTETKLGHGVARLHLVEPQHVRRLCQHGLALQPQSLSLTPYTLHPDCWTDERLA